MKGKLYLFPSTLGESDLHYILPQYNITHIADVKHFIVEDLRTARRFLKKCSNEIVIDDLQFYLLNKHTSKEEIFNYLKPLKEGHNVGLISEAGCPAIADPGADVVSLAQEADIQVIPLVGPSSILLAMMASGFNGQSFAFNGYLPIDLKEKKDVLRKLEARIFNEKQTQVFIETPYRNMKTLNELIQLGSPVLKLCIATDITLSTEFIKTRYLKDWTKNQPDLNKRPTIFILYQ
jgi:16S rRNA (cytidine1402-2'-O)-methyltransferase